MPPLLTSLVFFVACDGGGALPTPAAPPPPAAVAGLLADPSWHGSPTPAVPVGAVVAVADVNGDAYGDLVVGSQRADGNVVAEGMLVVYFGSPGGVVTPPAQRLEPIDQAQALLGSAVADLGDVNGDGFDDVAAQVGQSNTTALFYGSAMGLVYEPSWAARLDGAEVLGEPRRAGDLNGDGYDDLLVQGVLPTRDGDRVGAAVFLGGVSGLDPAAVTAVYAPDGSTEYRVQAAGDVNGDGFGDLSVSVFEPSLTDAPDALSAQLMLGSDVGGYSALATTWRFVPPDLADMTGRVGSQYLPQTFVGDVNGDGYDDGLVASIAEDDLFPDEGRAWLWHGGPTGFPIAAAWTAAPADQSGVGFTPAPAHGDVNGDGYTDVLVSAPYLETARGPEGIAWLYLGTSLGLASTEAWSASPANTLSGFGYAMTMGDINGDGYDDAVIGAPMDMRGSWGQVYVYLGCGGTPEVVGNLYDEDCDGTIACYVDYDEDGFVGPSARVALSDNARCDDRREALALSDPLDCDDDDALRNPDAAEVPDNEVDEDCDGLVLCWEDADLDGVAATVPQTLLSQDADCGDPGELVMAGSATDCDDSDAAVLPGRVEVPDNGLDEDCVGGDGHRAIDTQTPGTGQSPAEKKGCDHLGARGGLGLVVLLALRRRRR